MTRLAGKSIFRSRDEENATEMWRAAYNNLACVVMLLSEDSRLDADLRASLAEAVTHCKLSHGIKE